MARGSVGYDQRQNWSGKAARSGRSIVEAVKQLGKAGVLPSSPNRPFRYLGGKPKPGKSGGPE